MEHDSKTPICRLCLKGSKHSQLIVENDSLLKWIESLTSLKIVCHPKVPSSLCSKCKNILRNFESFRDMCISNEIIYNQMHHEGFIQELDCSPRNDENVSDKNQREVNSIMSPTLINDYYSDSLVDDDNALLGSQREMTGYVTIFDRTKQNEEFSEQNIVHNKTHVSEIKTKLCPVCNIAVNALRTHLLTHRDYKPFQCEYCSKTFNMMCNLNKHIRRHLQLKTFVCSSCDKGFTNSTELNVHIRTHTNEKPYQCKHCDKSFKTSGCMKRHVQSVHEKLRPHICEICHVKFTCAAHLRRHMLRHTLERPYSCSICNRKYARLDLLKVHSCR